MPTPKKSDVVTEVKRIISTFTTLGPHQLQDNQVLTDAPLRIDNIGLAFLAESLRGYVKQYVRTATVTAAEMRKSKRTVGEVTTLIIQKVGAV